MESKKFKQAALIGALLFVITHSAVSYGAEKSFQTAVILTSLYLFSSLFEVIMGIYAASIFSWRGNLAKALSLIAASSLFSFCGEIYYALYGVNQVPTPQFSIADLFFISGYIFFGLGIYFAIKSSQIVWTIGKRLVFWIVFGVVTLSNIFFIGGLQAAEVTGQVNIVAYVILSFLLIISLTFILLMAFEYQGGEYLKAWIAILISILLISFILVKVQLAGVENRYTNQFFLQLLLILSHISKGYGILLFALSAKSVQRKLFANLKISE